MNHAFSLALSFLAMRCYSIRQATNNCTKEYIGPGANSVYLTKGCATEIKIFLYDVRQDKGCEFIFGSLHLLENSIGSLSNRSRF